MDQIKQKLERLEDKYSKSDVKNDIFSMKRDLKFDSDPLENPANRWTPNEEIHIIVFFLILDAQTSPAQQKASAGATWLKGQ